MTFKYLTILLFALCLGGCSSSDDSSSDIDSMELEEVDASPFLGTFVDAAHPTSGMATVNTDRTELQLTNFKSDSGPLLELYLTNSLEVKEYISLGVLQGLKGDYTYTLPDNVDIEKYKYVVVWCVDFSVNFGYALLE
ncbi:DM13 domain-containing protein [Formosa sp. PL04]|uniref:DM13 domain-containing protein n=1 Tax=Formosa sp. PL04 TaxID=3081755 RepID=UPI00298133AB|nr:DM13 domain-containing protein [Formosa sp. PL04]MDW5288319.1 DM13 domain-containing protein [Formosa sp. PL04]